jgi:hypothetical protein
MAWKECLEAQQLKGQGVNVEDGDFRVEISINRQQFGSVQVAYRDRLEKTIVLGPKDSGQGSNPATFEFDKAAGPKGGQCGWIIQLARANNEDPFPDVDVEIVQASGSKLRHSYVCPDDEIPDTGIEIRDFVKLT